MRLSITLALIVLSWNSPGAQTQPAGNVLDLTLPKERLRPSGTSVVRLVARLDIDEGCHPSYASVVSANYLEVTLSVR